MLIYALKTKLSLKFFLLRMKKS